MSELEIKIAALKAASWSYAADKGRDPKFTAGDVLAIARVFEDYLRS